MAFSSLPYRDTCNLCTPPGTFASSNDVVEIRSNVRAFQHEQFVVWRCSNCQSIHSRSIVALAGYYHDYPFQREVADFGRRLIKRNYMRRLKRAGLQPDHSILDYGCGSGLLVDELRSHGCVSAFGYDAYTPQFADPKVLDRRYDFVIAQDVIEHVEDPGELLTKLIELTNPGGLICIGTPNAEGIDLRNAEDDIHSLHQPYHLHILSAGAMRLLAEKHGLATVHWYDTYFADTFFPFANIRFSRHYARLFDDTLDLAFEPYRFSWRLLTPKAMLLAFFGRLFPSRSEMMVLFRRTGGLDGSA